MKKMLICSNNRFPYNKYYLIKVCSKNIYGIMISNKMSKDFVIGIGKNKEKMKEVIKHLSNKDVSPLHLVDIIDEYT